MPTGAGGEGETLQRGYDSVQFGATFSLGQTTRVPGRRVIFAPESHRFDRRERPTSNRRSHAQLLGRDDRELDVIHEAVVRRQPDEPVAEVTLELPDAITEHARQL